MELRGSHSLTAVPVGSAEGEEREAGIPENAQGGACDAACVGKFVCCFLFLNVDTLIHARPVFPLLTYVKSQPDFRRCLICFWLLFMHQPRHEREHVTVRSRNLETKTSRCQSTVSSLGFANSLVERIEVERHKSNTQRAEVICLGSENLQLSQNLDRSEQAVVQLQARCDEFWRHHGPTQYTRDE